MAFYKYLYIYNKKKMDNIITYIYVLVDPRTNLVKYVGKTINPKMRFRTYIKQAKSGKRNNLVINWVKSLLKENLLPKMEIIDSIEGEWEWLEVYWISQFKTWGFNLKNMTDGGDANPMNNPDVRLKISNHMKNIIRDDEWGSNISLAKKGVKIHSKEQIKKYSNDNSGNGNPMYNKKHTTDALEKMKLPVLQYTLDGNFIKEWSSAADIERETDMLARSINRCAKGDRPSAYGYKWEYKNKKGRG
jgi:group I intron endonuclease